MDPIICTTNQSFSRPESAVMQAAIHLARFEGANRNAKMRVASRKTLLIVSHWNRPTRDLSVSSEEFELELPSRENFILHHATWPRHYFESI